jgi:hypothetical protein
MKPNERTNVLPDIKHTVDIFNKKHIMTRRDITDAKIIANIILYNDPIGSKTIEPIYIVGKKV